MGILSSLVDRVEHLKYKDSTEQETVYKIVDRRTHKALFGEYGKFKSSVIGTTKEYIDEFILYFETTVHAKYYLERYIKFFNAFEEDPKEELTESDFEIVETEYESSGLVLTFDIIKSPKELE